MSNCNKYEEYISLYIDDELGSEELLELLEHFDECQTCHNYYLELKNITEKIKNIHIEYPPELTEMILKNIEENKNIQIVQYKQPKRKMAYISLAACACFAIMLSSTTFLVKDKIIPAKDYVLAADQGPEALKAVGEAPNQNENKQTAQTFSENKSGGLRDASVLPDIALSEYAFVFTFEGSLKVPEIKADVLYSDDKVICIVVENNIPVIESAISTLEANGYINVNLTNTNYKIDAESKTGIIIILADEK